MPFKGRFLKGKKKKSPPELIFCWLMWFSLGSAWLSSVKSHRESVTSPRDVFSWDGPGCDKGTSKPALQQTTARRCTRNGFFARRVSPRQVGWAELGLADGEMKDVNICHVHSDITAEQLRERNLIFFCHRFSSWNSLMAYCTKAWKIRVIIRFLSVSSVLCFPLKPCWYAALTFWTAGSKNTPPFLFFFFWWRLSPRRINIIDWGI